MNRRIFYSFATLSIGTFVLMAALFLGAVYYSSTESVSRISSKIHATYVNEIIYNYKNELVSGNYRFFRNQISSMIEHEVFSDYALVQDGKIVESSDLYNSRVGREGFLKISVPVWFDEEKTQLWGSVELLVSDLPQNRIASAIKGGLLPFALLLLGLSFLFAALYFYLWQRVNASLGREMESIFAGRTGSGSSMAATLWKPLLGRLRSLKNSHDHLALRDSEAKKQLATVEITRQVAHDIRSPLATLNMISSQLDEVEEEKRVLIRHAVQRINDIANDLLQRGRSKASATAELTMMSSLVDQVVSEKRAQYRGKIHTRIEAELRDGYGIFSIVVDKDIKRALSNLIDNAVEALPAANGKVHLTLRQEANRAVVELIDNGCGIPVDLLRKIGERGASFGKEGSGSGLGLHQARSAVENSGGLFHISSAGLGKGTRVEISFPLAPAPEWFLASIQAGQDSTIITIDDDVAIHSLWKGRIRHRRLEQFSSISDLEDWVSCNGTLRDRLFLVDYEFHGANENGLDVIERLGIAAESVLVTSRFEDAPIQEKCRALGVKMIPKGLSSLVPIC